MRIYDVNKFHGKSQQLQEKEQKKKQTNGMLNKK
jgi:hypothetical protein